MCKASFRHATPLWILRRMARLQGRPSQMSLVIPRRLADSMQLRRRRWWRWYIAQCPVAGRELCRDSMHQVQAQLRFGPSPRHHRPSLSRKEEMRWVAPVLTRRTPPRPGATRPCSSLLPAPVRVSTDALTLSQPGATRRCNSSLPAAQGVAHNRPHRPSEAWPLERLPRRAPPRFGPTPRMGSAQKPWAGRMRATTRATATSKPSGQRKTPGTRARVRPESAREESRARCSSPGDQVPWYFRCRPRSLCTCRAPKRRALKREKRRAAEYRRLRKAATRGLGVGRPPSPWAQCKRLAVRSRVRRQSRLPLRVGAGRCLRPRLQAGAHRTRPRTRSKSLPTCRSRRARILRPLRRRRVPTGRRGPRRRPLMRTPHRGPRPPARPSGIVPRAQMWV
mmetsp:Transcript_17072/g.49466  ORF Transcript_17072/g.49466 Transcript_17072/m.49466 type:complete len:394 (+) Transcript_17072:890-2071(+)